GCFEPLCQLLELKVLPRGRHDVVLGVHWIEHCPETAPGGGRRIDKVAEIHSFPLADQVGDAPEPAAQGLRVSLVDAVFVERLGAEQFDQDRGDLVQDLALRLPDLPPPLDEAHALVELHPAVLLVALCGSPAYEVDMLLDRGGPALAVASEEHLCL